MYLKELVLQSYDEYDKSTEFDYSVNYIVDLYFVCLPKKTWTGDFGKLIIEVDDRESEIKIEELIDVLILHIPYRINQYFTLSDTERKYNILDILIESLSYLSSKYDWNKDEFDKAALCVKEKNYVNEQYWGKPVYSPNKKLKAQLFMKHTPKEIQLYVVVHKVRGKKDDLMNEYVTSVNPHWFFINDTLSEIHWTSDTSLYINKKRANKKWEFMIQNP